MEEHNTQSNSPLLYDPLFASPPDTVIRDTPGKGFWGKAAVKKTVFILILAAFVCASVVLSIRSLTKDVYRYEKTDNGYRLAEYTAEKNSAVLTVAYVMDNRGNTDEEKPVTSVRPFALCGDEYTGFIFIGKDVSDIADTAFYDCSNLKAILVDAGNPHYISDNGVLYRAENGQPTELMLYPVKNYLYRASLSLGASVPADAAAAAALNEASKELEKALAPGLEALRKGETPPDALTPAQTEALQDALRYDILPGIERIGPMCFAQCGSLTAVTIPEGVEEICTMAFFKCSALEGFRLPDSLTAIGSDAFSYCARVTDIFIPLNVKTVGHHAFYGCDKAGSVRLACAEENAPQTGEVWLPQTGKLIQHGIQVVYNAQREQGE